jgi:predicted dienelactone hydrolase
MRVSAATGQKQASPSGSSPEHAAQPGASYDPMKVASDSIEQLTLTVVDADRDRQLPIRVYLPANEAAAPVVLFSHGLGGSRDNSAYLGKHWAGRGYVAVFMQHPGSDESVWRNAPAAQRLAAMRQAANAENFTLRVEDVPAVIDQLEQWNIDASHPLGGRIDAQRIGMSGHSFGAVTTQAVSGQHFFGRDRFTDSRIKAALLMSPSVPRGADASRSFGQVDIPWLMMTGTHDTAIIGQADVESRLAVYPALPEGSKYELVLDGAEHSAFSERALPGDRRRRNPNHHLAILAISTAFWDAYLTDDAAARSWLDGEGPRQVLESADRWQLK